MKQQLASIFAVLFLCCMPVSAYAQANGLYLSLGGGITLPTDSDFSGTGISTSADLDAGWMGSGAIGYQFSNDIRAEFELAYRSSNVDALSAASNGSGEIGVGSAMGNILYSFRGESALTPYLGLGIGLASVNVDDVQPISGSVLDDSDLVVAYQGIAGLGYRLGERTHLFADYRYFATADSSLSTRTNVGVDGDYADHTFLFGLRFSFAEPKQAPKGTTKAEPIKQVTTAAAPAAPESAAPKITPVPPPPVVEVPRTYLVFFDWDKADLKPEALVIVREVAANTDRISVTRIQATGHADRSGSDQYNLELSRRRADAVRTELIRLGVPSGDIEILWKGEREPLVITADGVREPQNRRVVISLQ